MRGTNKRAIRKRHHPPSYAAAAGAAALPHITGRDGPAPHQPPGPARAVLPHTVHAGQHRPYLSGLTAGRHQHHFMGTGRLVEL